MQPVYIYTHTHTHTHCAHINTSSIKCYEYNQSACSSNNTNNPACFAHTSYLLPNAFRLLSLSLSLALLVPSDDLFVISSFVALYATAQTAIGTLSSAQRCCWSRDEQWKLVHALPKHRIRSSSLMVAYVNSGALCVCGVWSVRNSVLCGGVCVRHTHAPNKNPKNPPLVCSKQQ